MQPLYEQDREHSRQHREHETRYQPEQHQVQQQQPHTISQTTDFTTHLQHQNNNRPVDDRCLKFLSHLLVCVQELFGTLTYVFFGVMSIPVGPITGLYPLTQGIIYTVLQASTSPNRHGGLHLNPVITIAVAINGFLHPIMILPVIISQLIGCLIGAGLAKGCLSNFDFLQKASLYARIYIPDDLDSDYASNYGKFITAEMIFTAVLVSVFLRLLSSRPDQQQTEDQSVTNKQYVHAFFVGLTIAACGLAGLSMLCGCMNPFRAFGPTVIAATIELENTKVSYPKDNIWIGHWVYWLSPLIGAVVAAVMFKVQVFCRKK